VKRVIQKLDKQMRVYADGKKGQAPHPRPLSYKERGDTPHPPQKNGANLFLVVSDDLSYKERGDTPHP
jgi:hypothetical protein